MRIQPHAIVWLCTLVLLLGCARAGAVEVIAHRGASGYLPEHTLEAATLAYAQHADYIEQDVVASKDGALVVLHDIHLETVTNVEQHFAGRARDDGHFYALDFTLAELRQLQVHSRENAKQQPVFANRYRGVPSGFGIATLEEHIALITELNRQTGQHIGMYIEIKAPAWHRKNGVDLSHQILQALKHPALVQTGTPVTVQCFDFKEVRRLRNELDYKGRLVQLVAENSWQESATDYDWLLTPAGLKAVAKVADGIGPWIPMLADSTKKSPPAVAPWVGQARQLGLLIHPYTYRSDAPALNMQADTLLKWLLHTVQVDGVFTDQVPPVRRQLSQGRLSFSTTAPPPGG